jgi:hypothetical protein
MWWLRIHIDTGEEIALLTFFRIVKCYFLEDIKLTPLKGRNNYRTNIEKSIGQK